MLIHCYSKARLKVSIVSGVRKGVDVVLLLFVQYIQMRKGQNVSFTLLHSKVQEKFKQ